MKVKINELECKRCHHKWLPRKAEVMLCPKCHSPYWNKEKVSELGVEKHEDK